MTQLLQDSPYNPITDEEWERFFGLCDLSHLPAERQFELNDEFRKMADEYPLYRRLIREQTAPFHVTYSEQDKSYFQQNNSVGFLQQGENRIVANLALDSNKLVRVLCHEMRHRQQEQDGLFLKDSTRENVFTAVKLTEADSHILTAQHDETQGYYFNRLRQQYGNRLNEILTDADIPFAPGLDAAQRAEARALYIDTQASEQAAAGTINLFMQPNGWETAAAAVENGLTLTGGEVSYLEGWRATYQQQAGGQSMQAISVLDSGDDALQDIDAQKAQTCIEGRFPALRGKQYFQPGLTPDALEQEGLSPALATRISEGVTYFPGTKIKKTETVKREGEGYTVRVYNRDGTAVYEGGYMADGIRDGAEIWYDDNGTPIVEQSYSNGMKSGQAVYSFAQSDKQAPVVRLEEMWKDGECVERVSVDVNGQRTPEKAGLDREDEIAQAEANSVLPTPPNWDVTLMRKGYRPHDEKANCYVKDTDVPGVQDAVFVSVGTSLSSHWGQINEQGDCIGQWYSCRLDNTIEAIVQYKDGQPEFVELYDASGTTLTGTTRFDSTGGRYCTDFYGDTETPMVEWYEKDGQKISVKKYHPNGQLSCVSDKTATTYFTPEGQVLSESCTVLRNGTEHTTIVAYYPPPEEGAGKRGPIKSIEVEHNGERRITEYREDRSVIRTTKVNADGTGTETVWGMDGTPRTKGSINEQLQRTGSWQRPGGVVTRYEDGVPIAQSKPSSGQETMALKEALAENSAGPIPENTPPQSMVRLGNDYTLD